MGKDGKECKCDGPNGTCNCEGGNCGCCSTADGKNGACRCQGGTGAMCKNCKGKTGKIGKLIGLLVLAGLLRWLRSSMRGGTDIDIDTTPDNPVEQAIGGERIGLVAEEEEVDAVDPVDPVEVVDPAGEGEVADADIEEIVELLEEVLE